MTESKSSISKASSPAEIGEFWDDHDLVDYWAQTHEVEVDVDLKSPATTSLADKPLAEVESLEVTCVDKSDRHKPHERIINIGGVSKDRRWKMSQYEAIAAIESGRLSFYVIEGGNAVRVIVAKSSAGHEYLRTESDVEQPDSLLRLPARR
jgi:hypothetical protein